MAVKKEKKKLTYRIFVKKGEGEYVQFKDMTNEERADLGNFVRRRPMEALGYRVEEAG